MLNRYFVGNEELLEGSRIVLAGDELHHAVRVARCHPGERVELFTSAGVGAEAEFTAVDKNRAELRVSKLMTTSREPALQIILALALIQPEKFELVLQKATELGVSRFLPIISDHGEVRADRMLAKVERWERIVLEAVKQSGRVRIPPIDAPIAFEEVFTNASVVIYDAEADANPNRQLDSPVTILVGPEGGWSPGEIAFARERDAVFRRLGPRRLRAETAAIAAIVDIGLRFGDLS